MSKSNKNTEFFADYYRMTGTEYSFLKGIVQICFRHNIRYMYWWRKRNNPILGKVARVQLYRYGRKYGLEIGNAKIGKGLYLGHPYNITVNEDAVLGDNVSLHKGATVGKENRGKRAGAPKIGNNVFVGINATIVGKITIGDDVMVAPNSFVNFDVPSHSVVIGNPAMIKSRENATEGYVNFRV